MKVPLKKRLRLSVALLGLVVLIPLVGLLFSTRLLRLDDGNVQAEVIIVLGGDSLHRPVRALELFQSGAAPRILISGKGDCDEVRSVLAAKGVPAEAMEIEGESRNTSQNAEFAIRLLRAQKVKRAMIVTSWFHSRRALHCFQHYAPEIEFISMPTTADLPETRWPNKYERGWVLAEYVKLAGYWLRYGISPF